MCAAGRFIFWLGSDGDTNASGYQAAMAQACARAWRSAACGLHPSPGRHTGRIRAADGNLRPAQTGKTLQSAAAEDTALHEINAPTAGPRIQSAGPSDRGPRIPP